MYISPSHKFLAVSKNKKYNVTFNEFHYSQCKYAKGFILCPEIQFLHPRNLRPYYFYKIRRRYQIFVTYDMKNFNQLFFIY